MYNICVYVYVCACVCVCVCMCVCVCLCIAHKVLYRGNITRRGMHIWGGGERVCVYIYIFI